MLNKKVILFFAVFWTIFISVLSLIKLGDVEPAIAIPFKDKIVHFCFYFIFVSLWFLHFKSKSSNNDFKFKVVFVAIVFGILIEICQANFTSTRHGDILDVLANSLGAVSGMFFITSLVKNKTQ